MKLIWEQTDRHGYEFRIGCPVGQDGAVARVEGAEGVEGMSATLRLVAADTLDDIYVTEPANTPRVVWLADDSAPIDWSALVPDRAPKSGVRLRGDKVMGLEGM